MNRSTSKTTPLLWRINTYVLLVPFIVFLIHPSKVIEKRRRESIITMSRLLNRHSYAQHPISTFPHSTHIRHSPRMNIRPHAEQQFTSAVLWFCSLGVNTAARRFVVNITRFWSFGWSPVSSTPRQITGASRCTVCWPGSTPGLLSIAVLEDPRWRRGNELYMCVHMFCVLIVLTLSFLLCVQQRES